MSDLFEAAAQAEREAVRLLLPRLRSDEAIQRRHLNDAMTKAFGGSDADGRWTQRASFELLEHALAIHLQSSAQKIAAFGDVRALIDLSDRLPDWFGPSARMREQYETILRDVSVLAAVRLEKCYLKHGTSIAVRLFVIDKVPGRSPPALIQRSSVAELLDILIIPERSSAKPDRGASAPKRSGGV